MIRDNILCHGQPEPRSFRFVSDKRLEQRSRHRVGRPRAESLMTISAAWSAVFPTSTHTRRSSCVAIPFCWAACTAFSRRFNTTWLNASSSPLTNKRPDATRQSSATPAWLRRRTNERQHVLNQVAQVDIALRHLCRLAAHTQESLQLAFHQPQLLLGNIQTLAAARRSAFGRVQVKRHPAAGRRVANLVRDARAQHRQRPHLFRSANLLFVFLEHLGRAIHRRR